jgi:hypothetical protein
MNKNLVELIKAAFRARMMAKTGWGRNEVLVEFDAAINEALLDLLLTQDKERENA